MKQEWNCDQIRSKIRQYINSGEMKVSEFRNQIDVSAESYRTFLTQNGPARGINSATFINAAIFFKRRELAGIGMPKQKKAKTQAATEALGKDQNGAQGAKSKKQEKEDAARERDVSAISLPGEETDSVPIFDTCDDLRTKINRYMRETPGVSNASFIREINKSLPGNSSKSASTQQLTTFLSSKGPTKGAESGVFYAGYIFLEKLRIKQGKLKTKKRQEMEDVWGQKGLELVDIGKRGLWLRAGEKVNIDKYGKVSIQS